MLINPLAFTTFALLAYVAFLLARPAQRPAVLLLFSMAFFSLLLAPLVWPALALLVLATHWLGRRMAAQADPSDRRPWLYAGMALHLGALVAFKYAGVFHLRSLPAFIGISYLVFTALAYLLEIYFGSITAEPRLGVLSLHLLFFPKAIQGPIEAPAHLLPQLKESWKFDSQAFRSGLLLLGWGLFKKAVLADRLAYYVNLAFRDPQAASGPALLAASYAFALQLFCDFSGYTDMALGVARLFGFNLTQNFNAPYAARGMQDFWKRWHISLSNWILEYVFQPLQVAFRDFGTLGAALALFLSFLAMGIWHGATWGFVAFGLIQGIYMACALLYRPGKKKLHKALGWQNSAALAAWQVFFTFHLVVFSFIFFRCAQLGDALNVLRRIPGGWRDVWGQLAGSDGFLALVRHESKGADLAVLGAGLAVLFAVYLAQAKTKLLEAPAWVRWPAYYLLALGLLFFGIFFSQKQFIYSQF